MSDRKLRSDRSSASPDLADETSMVRHEEQLQVSTQTIALERVRMQRYIVTEERTVTVTVRHEEVRIIRERIDGSPIVDADDHVDQHADDHVMTLSEERVVVTTEIVPVERVRLRVDRIIDRQRVSTDVATERIDLIRDE